jgi:hypothetical protein
LTTARRVDIFQQTDKSLKNGDDIFSQASNIEERAVVIHAVSSFHIETAALIEKVLM